MMFGSDPFAGTLTERPLGITSGGGSPWRPSRGWRTRVKLPGGSLPITSRTSWPSFRRAAAWSSACSTTAPQNDHEYGTTIPTFIAHNYARLATFWPRHDRPSPRPARSRRPARRLLRRRRQEEREPFDDDHHEQGVDRPERHDADPGPAFDQGKPPAP